ncbi:hypothetical protein DFJ74DRAFT_722929 [Hyaloraphidium curvatum]|nr:hypothetical protein DFJ74DRAFT_722929 [Hyaloraphidium curvatum]
MARRAGRRAARALAAAAAFLLLLAAPAAAQNSTLCPPAPPTLGADQLPRIVKDDLGPDMLAFTISSPRVIDRKIEVYLGPNGTNPICSRSSVFSTDFTTCQDLYLLRDTWENLRTCGWQSTETDTTLSLNNTIHVRVYDNVKNPLGGYYTHTTGLRAPVTVTFSKTQVPSPTDPDPSRPTPSVNPDDGTPDDVDLNNPDADAGNKLATQNAYRVVKVAVDNSGRVRNGENRRLYIFIAASYFNPFVLSPKGVDFPDNVGTEGSIRFIVAAPDCADNAPTGAMLCTRGGEIVANLADGVCDVSGTYTVTYDRCQDTAAAPGADPSNPDCDQPYVAQFTLPPGTTVCSDPTQDTQALAGIAADLEPDKGAAEPNYPLGQPVSLVLQAQSSETDAPLTTIVLVSLTVSADADGRPRDVVRDEQPTDLGRDMQVAWPQPIDTGTGRAVISFTPTQGTPDALVPEADLQGERQFTAVARIRLYYPMQGSASQRKRARSSWFKPRGYGLVARQGEIPQMEELVELEVSAPFNVGNNFDTSNPNPDPDGNGGDEGPLPPPSGGPNDYSGLYNNGFLATGVMGWLALAFGGIALAAAGVKAAAGGDLSTDTTVEAARPKMFNTLPSFYDVFILSQHLFMLGCLNLGTADIFNEFAANFRWSVLVFRVPFLQSFAASIYGTDQYYTMPPPATGRGPMPPGQMPKFVRAMVGRDYDPYREHMDKGMQATALEIGINLGDYFITSFFLFLIIAGALILLGALTLFVMEIVREVRSIPKYRTVRSTAVTVTFSTLVRFWNLMYMPLVLFCVFQMSYDNKNDYVPWYMTFWCVVVFLSALIALPGYICYKILSTWPKDALYSHERTVIVLGTFYNTLKGNKIWFIVVDFMYRFMSGIFVGMGFTNGYVQSSLWALVIIVHALLVGLQMPYSRRERNFFQLVQSGVMLLALILLWSCNPAYSYDTRYNLSAATIVILCIFLVLCGVWIMYTLWKNIILLATRRREGKARSLDSVELDGSVEARVPLNGKTQNSTDGDSSDDTAVGYAEEDGSLPHYTDEDRLLPGYNPEPITLSFGTSKVPPATSSAASSPATQRARWSGAPSSSGSRSTRKAKPTAQVERNDSSSEVPSFDDIMKAPASKRVYAPSVASEDPSSPLVSPAGSSSMDPTQRASAVLENMKTWTSSRGAAGTNGSKAAGSYLDDGAGLDLGS